MVHDFKKKLNNFSFFFFYVNIQLIDVVTSRVTKIVCENCKLA